MNERVEQQNKMQKSDVRESIQNLRGPKAQITRLLVLERELTRSEIGQRLHLSPSTISRNVQELLDLGLLCERDERDSGGQKRTILRFSEDAGVLIGVDMGANHLKIATTTLAYDVIDSYTCEIDLASGPSHVLGLVVQIIEDRVLSVTPINTILGMGIGVPGPVDFIKGVVEAPPIMPGWNLFPIREHLEAELGMPVFIENDVNVLAFGEYILERKDKAESSFLYVKIATGVGAGIVVDGHIHRGADGSAGDIGHIRVEGNEWLCSCGKTGCLEAVASGSAIVRQAKQTLKNPNGEGALVDLFNAKADVTAKDISLLASQGDATSVQIMKNVGSVIGEVLASLVNFCNPSAIVIGGGVAASGDLLLASIREAIYKTATPLATRNLRILRAVDNDFTGAIGAVALVLQDTCTEQC